MEAYMEGGEEGEMTDDAQAMLQAELQEQLDQL
jgi:hypothetical protein